VAIFDATNSTRERRQWILEECAKCTEKYQQRQQALGVTSQEQRIGVLFLELICDDPEFLAENFRVKISSCPDFGGMSQQEALEDSQLQTRIAKYESQYETLDINSHELYIKIFNLSSRLMVNHVYVRLAKVVLPAIMAWNTLIFLCRAGETQAMELYMKQQQALERQSSSAATEEVDQRQDTDTKPATRKFQQLLTHLLQRKRSDRLGPRGLRFRDALSDFIEKEGTKFMN
jgi:hypothetical protein